MNTFQSKVIVQSINIIPWLKFPTHFYQQPMPDIALYQHDCYCLIWPMCYLLGKLEQAIFYITIVISSEYSYYKLLH